jgi:hypothetical protein
MFRILCKQHLMKVCSFEVTMSLGCCKSVCLRITGDIVKNKYNSGFKYSFVMYRFLHGCNCHPCPLCSIIKHHNFNWELSVTCFTCKTLSVCRLYFPVLYYYRMFPILSQNFSSAGWVFCPCQVWQIWGYSMCQLWPHGSCIVSLFFLQLMVIACQICPVRGYIICQVCAVEGWRMCQCCPIRGDSIWHICAVWGYSMSLDSS